jgi:hypothetical protein
MIYVLVTKVKCERSFSLLKLLFVHINKGTLINNKITKWGVSSHASPYNIGIFVVSESM